MVFHFNVVQLNERTQEIDHLTNTLEEARREQATWALRVSLLVEELEDKGIENP